MPGLGGQFSHEAHNSHPWEAPLWAERDGLVPADSDNKNWRANLPVSQLYLTPFSGSVVHVLNTRRVLSRLLGSDLQYGPVSHFLSASPLYTTLPTRSSLSTFPGFRSSPPPSEDTLCSLTPLFKCQLLQGVFHSPYSPTTHSHLCTTTGSSRDFQHKPADISM